MLVFNRLVRSTRILLAALLAVVVTTTLLPAPAHAQQGPGADALIRPAPPAGNVTTYTVQPGDTLSSIARRHNTTVAVLMSLNPQIQNPNQLRVGQQIWVPATGPGNPRPPTGPRPPAVIPPHPPQGEDFTRTQVFFINRGNTGPGWDTGCGGNAAPATVLLTPATQAVLRGSLDYLLSVRDAYYKNTGLYHALFRSRLTLNNLTLQNGVATIWLTGNLVTSGLCDSARQLAQIEQTALQFSTVNRVQVYVNGQPYVAATPF
jgi:LysM repeat protein